MSDRDETTIEWVTWTGGLSHIRSWIYCNVFILVRVEGKKLLHTRWWREEEEAEREQMSSKCILLLTSLFFSLDFSFSLICHLSSLMWCACRSSGCVFFSSSSSSFFVNKSSECHWKRVVFSWYHWNNEIIVQIILTVECDAILPSLSLHTSERSGSFCAPTLFTITRGKCATVSPCKVRKFQCIVKWHEEEEEEKEKKRILGRQEVSHETNAQR